MCIIRLIICFQSIISIKHLISSTAAAFPNNQLPMGSKILNSNHLKIEMKILKNEDYKLFKRNKLNLTWSSKFYMLTQEYLLENKTKDNLKKKFENKFNIKFIKELGAGAFGTVYQATLNGQIIAIKLTSSKTSQSSSRYYNIYERKSCCISPDCLPPCKTYDTKTFLTIEATALLLSHEVKNVIKLKGFGIISDTTQANYPQIAFFITIMEFKNQSMTVDNFAKNCIQKLLSNKNTKVNGINLMKQIMSQFYKVNKELYDLRIYHNDLKTDNTLIQFKNADQCPKGSNNFQFQIFLIDFGNAIIDQSESNKEFRVKRETFLPSFRGNMAPEFELFIQALVPYRLNQEPLVKPLLSWYLGAYLFEMCSLKHIRTFIGNNANRVNPVQNFFQPNNPHQKISFNSPNPQMSPFLSKKINHNKNFIEEIIPLNQNNLGNMHRRFKRQITFNQMNKLSITQFDIDSAIKKLMKQLNINEFSTDLLEFLTNTLKVDEKKRILFDKLPKLQFLFSLNN